MLAWGNLKFYKFNWEKYVHWQTSLGFPLLKLKGSKSELHNIMILVHIPLCRYEHIYSEILTAKFRLKLKKVGKTTKPFRYDRNQIPCYYTVEVTNRFKAFDLIGRVPEELWMRFATLYRRQGSRPSPRKRNVKRQNGCLRRPYKELREEKLKARRKDSASESCSVVFGSLRSDRLCSPGHSPGQNTRASSCSTLQGIVPTQGSNPGLLHCGRILYQLSTREALVGSHQRRQRRKEKIYPFECRVPKNSRER